MDQTMQHFNQYSATSPFAWDGLQSNRFGKTRVMLPRRDLIKSGTNLPTKVSTFQTRLSSAAANTTMSIEVRSTSSAPNSGSSHPRWNIGILARAVRRSWNWSFPSHILEERRDTSRNPSSNIQTNSQASEPFITRG